MGTRLTKWGVLLVTVTAVGAGCAQPPSPPCSVVNVYRSSSVSPLVVMPPVDRVPDVDGVGTSHQFAVKVAADSHLDGPIDLQVGITNSTDAPVYTVYSTYHSPERCFAVWVMRAGQQVPLTPAGVAAQPRKTLEQSVGGGPLDGIAPGATEVLHMDLAKLFAIHDPGQYTAVVLGGVFDEYSWLTETRSAKTVFSVASPR